MKFTSFARTATCTFTLALACALPALAELQGRDIGNTGATNAFYDTTLKVTWLDLASGSKTWDQANAWASNLNVAGLTGWRLPTMTVANPNTVGSNDGSTDKGYNVPGSSSEMASLFYDTLGNKAFYDTNGNSPQAGFGLTNTGGFNNLQPRYYWLGTEYAPIPNLAWTFGTGSGIQTAFSKNEQFYSLAVRPGDVSPAPEPETYLMLLMGLGLVGVISRRRSKVVGSSAL